MIKKFIIVIFLIALPNLTLAAYSCNNQAVAYEGDTSSDIKIKCGPPMDVERLGLVEIHGKFVNLERWVYNPGYGKFYQILEFQNGVLISITTGHGCHELHYKMLYIQRFLTTKNEFSCRQLS